MRAHDPFPDLLSDINRVVLVGVLGEAPEVRELDGGVSVCFLRLDYLWRQPAGLAREREPQYVNVLVLGASVARIARYLYPGRRIVVDGMLSSAHWAGPDATPRDIVCVLARRLEFLGPAPEWVFGPGGDLYACGDRVPGGEHPVGFSEDIWI